MIIDIVEKYLTRHSDETKDLCAIYSQAKSAKNDDEIVNRKNFVGHCTASVFLVNPINKKVLLLDHKALKRKLTPGGHIEKDETPLEAAFRELEEETGLKSNQVEQYLPNKIDKNIPFHIGSYPIPKNDKEQEDEHYHHNFEYVFFIKPNSEVVIDATESDGYEWIDFDMAIDILGRPKMKYKKLLEEK